MRANVKVPEMVSISIFLLLIDYAMRYHMRRIMFSELLVE
jgi:hypothetical protein